MDASINNKISEIEDKINMIHIDMHVVYWENIEKLHLIYVKLKKFNI